MKIVRVINESRGVVLCEKCGIADNILTRVRGLLGRSTLGEDEGLLIVPCPSIHMFGMKFSIDVLFLTRDNVVTDLVENIAPGKYYVAKPHVLLEPLPTREPAHNEAHSALELPSGTITRTSTQRGDQLSLQ